MEQHERKEQQQYTNMTVTVRQLLDAQPVLQMIASKPLNATTAWKVASCLRRINDDVVVAGEARSKLLAKYSDIVGDNYVPRKETLDVLTAELEELLSQEVVVNVTPLNISLIDKLEITASQAFAVDWIFVEDDK